MYWRDVVTLKAVTEGRDADGYPKETITETTVFADVSSTKRSEFYAARQAGISLALTVKVRAADYDGQERLSFEGKEYKVERAYGSYGYRDNGTEYHIREKAHRPRRRARSLRLSERHEKRPRRQAPDGGGRVCERIRQTQPTGEAVYPNGKRKGGRRGD